MDNQRMISPREGSIQGLRVTANGSWAVCILHFSGCAKISSCLARSKVSRNFFFGRHFLRKQSHGNIFRHYPRNVFIKNNGRLCSWWQSLLKNFPLRRIIVRNSKWIIKLLVTCHSDSFQCLLTHSVCQQPLGVSHKLVSRRSLKDPSDWDLWDFFHTGDYKIRVSKEEYDITASWA